ncbi:MAG: hypothetical protein MZU97_01400 [Bacillus subtilis]|nr:hypothetical protein [Bacillus subtilis]
MDKDGTVIDGDQLDLLHRRSSSGTWSAQGFHGRAHQDEQSGHPQGAQTTRHRRSIPSTSATNTSSTPSTPIDWSIGGENSGHIINRRLLPTGDGVLNAAYIVSLMEDTGRRFSDVLIGSPDVSRQTRQSERHRPNAGQASKPSRPPSKRFRKNSAKTARSSSALPEPNR